MISVLIFGGLVFKYTGIQGVWKLGKIVVDWIHVILDLINQILLSMGDSLLSVIFTPWVANIITGIILGVIPVGLFCLRKPIYKIISKILSKVFYNISC